jgi:hypothetical protein
MYSGVNAIRKILKKEGVRIILFMEPENYELAGAERVCHFLGDSPPAARRY